MKMKQDLQNLQEINDEIIKSIFIQDINGQTKLKRGMGIKTIKCYPFIFNYLQNRFQDREFNLPEVLYRIYYHIEQVPLCKTCEKQTAFKDFQHGYAEHCCCACANRDKDVREKQKQTCLLHFGSETPFGSNEIKCKIKETNLKKYGDTCYLRTEDKKIKAKQTSLLKYGTESPNQAKEIKEKKKQIYLKKYGVENPSQVEDVKKKKKETCLRNHGAEFPMQSQEILKKSEETKELLYGDKHFSNKEKRKETCLNRHGVENPSQIKEIKQKKKETFNRNYNSPEKRQELEKRRQETFLKHYGTPYFSQSKEGKEKLSKLFSSEEMQKKIYETKKKNNSFNRSKIEMKFYDYLNENYHDDFIYQYRSEKYPFNCDFYIISLDLYIELQGSWIHGKHPFNENEENDIKIVKKWKSKHSKFYDKAIQVWSQKDVQKRNLAKQNGLNYLEIFSIDLNECIKALKNQIETTLNCF